MLGKIDASLIKKLNSVEWGEYKLGEIFDTETWVYGKNKQWKTRYEKAKDYRYPVISGITVNNGINYYTEDIPNENEIFEDSLTISTRGEYSGTVTYHDGKFLLANNILVLKMPGWTKNQKLFIGTIINSLNYGGYSNYPRIETLRNDIVYLPISNSEINFDFMESFISKLEEERINELEAYLQITELDDYELTEDEKNVLNKYETVEWNDYMVGDVFDICSTCKKFDANKINITESDGYPYIVRMSSNNGCKGYINQNPIYLNDGNTFSFGQDTATIFYQEKPYFTGDKIKIMKSKTSNLNRKSALFFLTSMEKAFSKYSWGASRFNVDNLKKEIFKLPIKHLDIDIEFMNLFISAISKLVIKDVVLYKNKKIELTK